MSNLVTAITTVECCVKTTVQVIARLLTDGTYPRFLLELPLPRLLHFHWSLRVTTPMSFVIIDSHCLLLDLTELIDTALN